MSMIVHCSKREECKSTTYEQACVYAKAKVGIPDVYTVTPEKDNRNEDKEYTLQRAERDPFLPMSYNTIFHSSIKHSSSCKWGV